MDKKTITIKQVGSPIRRPKAQRAILTGLGVNELSMTASDVPAVKAMLRAGSHAGMQELARKALACTSFEQVKALGSAA